MPFCIQAMTPRGFLRCRRISEQSAGESDSALMAEITIDTDTATANCW
jgi:hypothetical protein